MTTPYPMDTAPKDGTIVRLLVRFTSNGFEDVGPEEPTWTIGQNGADHHPEDDEWLFAGWNWEQDRFTQGHGEPIGWLPLHGEIAAQVVEEFTLPNGWTVKRSGVEVFVCGPNGGGWLARKGTLWQRTLFDLVDALSSNSHPQLAGASDRERLDWLELQHVEVRTPLRYGSRTNFHASPDEDDERSDLRARIDAARVEAGGDANG